MARLSRLTIAGSPHLVSQRGSPEHPVFADDLDRQLYLDLLVAAATIESTNIHAYALLDTEILLLVTPLKTEALGRMMQRVNKQYVRAFHKRHGTKEAVWAGRYDSSPLEPEHYLLRAMRYVEQGPVRAELAARSRDWRWSSAFHHLGVKPHRWITGHPAYWKVGNTPFEREVAHEQMIDDMLSAEEVSAMAAAVRRARPLGSAKFLHAIAATGRVVVARPRGRPKLREQV